MHEVAGSTARRVLSLTPNSRATPRAEAVRNQTDGGDGGLAAVVAATATAFVGGVLVARRRPRQRSACTWVSAAATESVAAPAVSEEQGEDKKWRQFVSWITAKGGDLSAVTMASPNGMRGLTATRDIAAGESIIELPLGAVIELSDDDHQKDLSFSALTLLKLYKDPSSTPGGDASPYFDLFPPPGSEPMATMPDFFSDAELDLMQHPPASAKTQRRKSLCQERAKENNVDVADVTWAWCAVAQRSFTVLSPLDGVLRLLLPGIDMLNHDSDSLHAFKVRWNLHGVFEGTFKVVAGSPVKKGEEICICYGGSPGRPDGCDGDCKGDVAWTNDQYLQRYGFVDSSIGSTMVDGRWLTSDAAAPVREALAQTSVEEDEALLKDESLSVAARAAIEFRVHMKRALVAGQEAKRRVEQSGDADLFEAKEPKPHILPELVKAQLQRAGVAFNGAGDAALRELLLSDR